MESVLFQLPYNIVLKIQQNRLSRNLLYLGAYFYAFMQATPKLSTKKGTFLPLQKKNTCHFWQMSPNHPLLKYFILISDVCTHSSFSPYYTVYIYSIYMIKLIQDRSVLIWSFFYKKALI